MLDSVDITPADLELTHVRLTSAPLLVRNTVWSLIGQIAPMLVALVAIPLLIRGLGVDRFGVLTLAWMVVGYFSLFDLGLGRALTALLAQRLACDDRRGLVPLIWTANVTMILLGLTGGMAFLVASPWLVHDVLKIPPALQHEVLASFYLLSGAVPFAVSTAGFRAVLESKQRFGIINAVRVPMGIATFLAPLCVLAFGGGLEGVVLVLTVARAVFWAIFVFLALREVPQLQRGICFRREMLPELLTFGGWMTVSNIISPVMVYLDRLLVGALLSITAVSYYATPFEVSTKLLIVSAALVGVLFPAFSTSLTADRQRSVVLFRHSVKYVSLAIAPVVFLFLVFAHDGLLLWLGPDFAAHSTAVLQWITIGVFINSISLIPFAFVQAAGRPDITAKFHLAELGFYLLTLVGLTYMFGIVGTALAWSIRLFLDCLCLFWYSSRIVRTPLWKECWLGVTSLMVCLGMPLSLLNNLPLKSAIAVVLVSVFLSFAWSLALNDTERAVVAAEFSKLRALAAFGTAAR